MPAETSDLSLLCCIKRQRRLCWWLGVSKLMPGHGCWLGTVLEVIRSAGRMSWVTPTHPKGYAVKPRLRSHQRTSPWVPFLPWAFTNPGIPVLRSISCRKDVLSPTELQIIHQGCSHALISLQSSLIFFQYIHWPLNMWAHETWEDTSKTWYEMLVERL